MNLKNKIKLYLYIILEQQHEVLSQVSRLNTDNIKLHRDMAEPRHLMYDQVCLNFSLHSQ
jgi:hypothetical protein